MESWETANSNITTPHARRWHRNASSCCERTSFDLTLNDFFSASCKTPPTIPACTVSNAFWVKQCYAALMLLLQNICRTTSGIIPLNLAWLDQPILPIVGHQAPTRDTRHPTLHRAAYWHLSTVGKQNPKPSVTARGIILSRSPRSPIILKI